MYRKVLFAALPLVATLASLLGVAGLASAGDAPGPQKTYPKKPSLQKQLQVIPVQQNSGITCSCFCRDG